MEKMYVLNILISIVLLFFTACDVLLPSPQPTLEEHQTKIDGELTQLITNVPASKTPSEKTTKEKSTPQVTEAPTQEPVPTFEPEPRLKSIEMAPGIWLTYDMDVWEGVGGRDNPYIQSHGFMECAIYLNNGHGMSDIFEVLIEQKLIGKTDFTMSTWRYIDTENVVLRGYTWEDQHFFSVEGPNAEVLPSLCLQEAEAVLRQSEALEFKAISFRDPNVIVAHPIVYSKDFNLYAFFTESNEILQITHDGGEKEGEDYIQYYNPRVSPDGRFVAFEKFSNQSVLIYSFDTGETLRIEELFFEEQVSDTLMGWDKNGLLYFSRAYGKCDLMQEENQGPSEVYVMSYDIDYDQFSLESYLPVMGSIPGSYSKGFDVSPSGRYFSFWATSCDAGWPEKAFVFDSRTTEVIDHGIIGDISLSHSEDRLAYSTANRFDENYNIYVAIADIGYGGAWYVDNFPNERTVWSKPQWSFDDRYLLISQNEITDPEIAEYTFVVWWVLGNTNLVMVDTQDSSSQPISITGDMSSDAEYVFGAWSPEDYQMVLIKRASRIDFEGDKQSELWLVDPLSGSTYLIDKGDYIQNVDW